MRTALSVACALTFALLPACSAPRILDDLQTEAPPEELTRPGWVRAIAGFGGWLGAAAGGVVSIAALPVTYPISLIADEPLGYSKSEFMLFPLVMGASTGHFIVGTPPEMLHYMFYRAWTDHPRTTDYEYTPVPAPMGPGEAESDPAPPAAGAPAEPATEQGEGGEAAEKSSGNKER